MASYTLKIDIRGLSVFTSGTNYWSMRNNTSGNRMFIKKIFLMSEFSGVAAASLSMFGYFRFSTATPSGGNAISATQLDTASSASNLLDCRFATAGLTMTNVVVESTPVFITSTINQLISSNIPSPLDFPPLDSQTLILNPGEGLVIQAFNTLVAGIGLHGIIQWTEGI